MLTICELRNKTSILDLGTLKSMESRFKHFMSDNAYDDAELAWEAFTCPAQYRDFVAFAGEEFLNDGKLLSFVAPYGYDTKKGKTPTHATVHPKPITGNFAGPVDVKYPLSGDLRIRCEAEVVGEEREHLKRVTVMMSLNELSGRTRGGRDSHCADFKCSYLPNPSSKDLEQARGGHCDPLYRVTPDGQPTVKDLLSIGTRVKSNYSDTEYLVEMVHEHTYEAVERFDVEHAFTEYSLSLICAKTNKRGYCINSLVAVDGRILKLFYENLDEVFILEEPIELPVVVDDDEPEEECCYIVTTPPVKGKRYQPSLF